MGRDRRGGWLFHLSVDDDGDGVQKCRLTQAKGGDDVVQGTGDLEDEVLDEGGKSRGILASEDGTLGSAESADLGGGGDDGGVDASQRGVDGVGGGAVVGGGGVCGQAGGCGVDDGGLGLDLGEERRDEVGWVGALLDWCRHSEGRNDEGEEGEESEECGLHFDWCFCSLELLEMREGREIGRRIGRSWKCWC